MAENLDELRREYEEHGQSIGRLLQKEVEDAAKLIMSSATPDPVITAEDVAQELALRLLSPNYRDDTAPLVSAARQLDYILAVSTDLDDFSRLLRREGRRTIARLRQRSVIDNLLDRCVALLDHPPFVELNTRGVEAAWALADSTPALREPTDDELHQVAVAAAAIPKRRPERGDKAPSVYTREDLQRLLETVASWLPCPLTRGTLRAVFARLLADWTVSVLREELEQPPAAEGLTPDEQAIAAELVERIVADLRDEELRVLRLVLEDRSWSDIAARIGRSRPTIATRRAAIVAVLNTHLSDVSRPVASAALERLQVLDAPS